MADVGFAAALTDALVRDAEHTRRRHFSAVIRTRPYTGTLDPPSGVVGIIDRHGHPVTAIPDDRRPPARPPATRDTASDYGLIGNPAFDLFSRHDPRLRVGFTPAELKATFRRLALRFHPDRHARSDRAARRTTTAQFRAIYAAYRELRNRACV